MYEKYWKLYFPVYARRSFSSAWVSVLDLIFSRIPVIFILSWGPKLKHSQKINQELINIFFLFLWIKLTPVIFLKVCPIRNLNRYVSTNKRSRKYEPAVLHRLSTYSFQISNFNLNIKSRRCIFSPSVPTSEE